MSDARRRHLSNPINVKVIAERTRASIDHGIGSSVRLRSRARSAVAELFPVIKIESDKECGDVF